MSRRLAELRLALRCLFRKKRVDDELDEELQFHLEREIDEGLKAGSHQTRPGTPLSV